jgi:hypothetical protein
MGSLIGISNRQHTPGSSGCLWARIEKAFERKAQSAKQLCIAITAVERLDTGDEDADELIRLIQQLVKTLLVRHLMLS